MSLVAEYQPHWQDDFRKVKSYILTELITFVVIEHIGSTSIPGMVAKPIIDLIIIVPDGQIARTISELAALEYRHQGDLGIPGRECFDYLPPHIDLPTHHLYASYRDQSQVAGSLAFRDFLRTHADWRVRLSKLKLELDKSYDSDRRKYMDGKKQMVKEIIQIALQSNSHSAPK